MKPVPTIPQRPLVARVDWLRATRLPGVRAIAIAGVSPEAVTLVVGLACFLFAWLPGAPFRLELFDDPKDIALGIAGVTCGVLLLEGPAPWRFRLDAPFAACIAWGLILTLFVATNTALGWHVLGIFCASALLFLVARRVGSTHGTRVMFLLISTVLFAFCVLVLLEAFGGVRLFSSPGRRPGATLGNRNLAARVACLSLPLLWHQLVVAKRDVGRCLLVVATASAAAVIAISRSRGAFVVASILFIALPVAAWYWTPKSTSPAMRRISLMWAFAVSVGVSSAVLIPNALGWSTADFVSSAKRVNEYDMGSGRGRLIQIETTARMIRATGILGVGPGNWSTWYPRYALAGDPSVRLGSFYPAPLIPRNDIVGFIAEFGLIGFGLALLSALSVLTHARAMTRQSELAQRHFGLLIIAMMIASGLLGLFDSVSRVPSTAGLSAVVIGLALGRFPPDKSSAPSSRLRAASVHLVVVGYTCAAFALARGAWKDFAAVRIIMTAHTVGDMYRAASVAPSNIEAQMLLGYLLIGVKRCDLAQPHLAQVASLEPYSLAVRALQKQCPTGIRTVRVPLQGSESVPSETHQSAIGRDTSSDNPSVNARR